MGVGQKRGSEGAAVSTSGLCRKPIARILKRSSHEHGSLHRQARGRSPISIKIHTLLHSPRAHPFPVATLNLNHANRVSTTEGEGWNHLIPEYCHRGLESREGGLKYHPSQGRFRFRQYPSHNDQGIFPPLLRRGVPNSYVARTPWSINGTMSNSGLPARTYVEPLTVGSAEGNWTSSADPRARRLAN